MPKQKVKKNKIVLAGGCFDILHYGHVHFLEKARKLGTKLVVALESDQSIKKLKGKNRPIHNQNQRRKILESLKFVDEVIILKNEMSDADYLNLVKKVRPFIIAVTEDDPAIGKKKIQAGTVGAKVVKISKIEGLSTSRIYSQLLISS